MATNQILADLEDAIESLVEADLTYTVELTFAEGRPHDANPWGFDIRWAGKITMKNENEKNYDGSKEIELWAAGFERIFLTVDFEDGYGEFDSGWIYYHPSYGGWFTGHENVLLYTNIRIDGVPPVSVWWTPWWDD